MDQELLYCIIFWADEHLFTSIYQLLRLLHITIQIYSVRKVHAQRKGIIFGYWRTSIYRGTINLGRFDWSIDSESEVLIDPWIVNMYTVYIYYIFITYIFIIHCIYRLPTIYHWIQVPSFTPTSMDQEAAALCIRQVRAGTGKPPLKHKHWRSVNVKTDTETC